MQLIRRSRAPAVSIHPQPLMAGFLAIQFFLGYEWFMSGFSKIVAGDFASGLAATLSDMTRDQSGWYKSFVDGVVIPNGQMFGNLVMVGEIGLGIVMVVAAIVWLTRWSQLSVGERTILLGAVALAALVGSFVSLNFHVAVGATAPWLISPDPNYHGVDLDSLMVVMQLVLAVVSLRCMVSLHHADR
jgi:uncharacterized membrane protein YphA (DoxX/SURF4 family)